jgi:hypothetical protein
MRISNLANNLRLLGDEIDDTKVVEKVLQVVSDRFMQVAISIETLRATPRVPYNGAPNQIIGQKAKKVAPTAALF